MEIPFKMSEPLMIYRSSSFSWLSLFVVNITGLLLFISLCAKQMSIGLLRSKFSAAWSIPPLALKVKKK